MTLEEAFETIKKKNDEAAWQVFYTGASQPLLAYVSALLVTFDLDAGETTQDIVHDVMLAFLKKWPGLKKELSSVGSASAEALRLILLEQVIGLLQTDCASLLRTYISQDLTPAEIAEREGASAAALYSRWYRCLQKARAALKQNPSILRRL